MGNFEDIHNEIPTDLVKSLFNVISYTELDGFRAVVKQIASALPFRIVYCIVCLSWMSIGQHVSITFLNILKMILKSSKKFYNMY